MKLIAGNWRTILTLCLFFPMAAAVRAQAPSSTIEIHAHRYAFTPSEITLKPNETVKLKLISDDVTHSLLIPGLNINKEVAKGHPVEIDVTPTSVGDFRGQCGRFCGSGHGSMLFVVHVKE